MFKSLLKLLSGPDTSDPRITGGRLCGRASCPRCGPIVKKIEKENHQNRVNFLKGKNPGEWNDGGI